MTGFTQSNLITECCFDLNIVYSNQQPIGFEDWSKLITKNKCRVILPDNTSIDIRMYIDLNGVFDNNAFTNFLINRYKEL